MAKQSTAVRVVLPAELVSAADARAARMGLSRSAYLRTLLVAAMRAKE
jgi:hypothetical protein